MPTDERGTVKHSLRVTLTPFAALLATVAIPQ
jgi:hypothetical protein